MYKVDWNKLINNNVPVFMRTQERLEWLQVAFKGIKTAYNRFLNIRSNARYRLTHTGQIIYLEKVLNDAFDNDQRRIFIDDGDFRSKALIFHRPEETLMIYRSWKFNTSYQIGDRVVLGRFIYEALTSHTNKPPESNPNDWKAIALSTLIKSRAGYKTGIRFFVFLPVGLVYDINRMKALVNSYKILPHQYQIVTI